MSTKVDLLDNNMAKLTVEVPAEELEEAMQHSYNKQKKDFSMPGFRKGRVPRQIIEQMYGPGIFYEDAANELVQKNYPEAYDESGLDIVSQPEIEVVQIEKGKPFIFTAEVAVKPEVTLGDYKGLPVYKFSTEVSDEEVDAKIQEEVEKNARTITVEDRPVENGDDIILDFDGYIDGEQFEGGQAANYALTVGSNSFIPGFEEQLVGKNPEEDFDVTVTFPEDYPSDEVKGKEAVFKCRVHEIKTKEYPEVDDEFASEVSEFDTLDEYKADVRKQLEKEKEDQGKRDQEDQALREAVDNATMDIPEPMIESQTRQMVSEFSQQLQNSGMTLDLYLQYCGIDQAALEEQMKPQAIDRIKSRLTLEAIVAAEGIECSEERLNQEIEDMAKSYDVDPDQLREMMGDYEIDQMKQDLAVQDALKLLTDEAVEVEKPEEPEEEAVEEEAENLAEDADVEAVKEAPEEDAEEAVEEVKAEEFEEAEEAADEAEEEETKDASDDSEA